MRSFNFKSSFVLKWKLSSNSLIDSCQKHPTEAPKQRYDGACTRKEKEACSELEVKIIYYYRSGKRSGCLRTVSASAYRWVTSTDRYQSEDMCSEPRIRALFFFRMLLTGPTKMRVCVCVGVIFY